MADTQAALETPRRWRVSIGEMGITGEIGVVAGITTAIALLFWQLGAAVLDTPGYLDPWIYRALFRNFDYLFAAFNFTYYPSRLPWIIPGRLANTVFGPVPAFFVLHAAFILAAALSAYLLLRRFFGPAVALTGYAALLLNVIFFDAHSDDYTDGPQITYLLLMLAAMLLSVGARRPALWMFASGVFACAALGTNLFDAFFVAGGLVAYLVVVSARDRFIQQFVRDIAAFASGAIALVVVLGGYAKKVGGEFLFFMPSVRAAKSLPTANWRITSFGWIEREPRVFATVFLVLLALVVLRPHLRRWRTDPTIRVAAGLTAYLAFVTTTLAIWEFALRGQAVFEVAYYFSVFTTALVPTAAATVGLAIRDTGFRSGGGRFWLVALAIAAAALPDLLVYSISSQVYTDNWLMGHTTFVIEVVAMPVIITCAAVGSLAGIPKTIRRTGLVAVIGGALFCLNLSAAGSITSYRFSTHTGAASYHARLATLHLSDQLIDFMRDTGLQSTALGGVPAAFWINAASDPGVNSVQSAYLYGWTAVGYDLPRVDSGMRTLLEQRRPHFIVLLCAHASCDGGAAALRRVGYGPRFRATRRLSSGGKQIWARVYKLPGFAGGAGQIRSFYKPSESPLSTASGTSVQNWNLARRGIKGWAGGAASAAAAAGGKPFETTSYVSSYELTSPELLLPAGTYRVLVGGRVLRGGLDIGVLDLERNAWISHSYYWYGQRWSPSRWMATAFVLSEPEKVEIVLLNWVPHEMHSRWQLKELRVVSVP